jgi:hypothetical protein
MDNPPRESVSEPGAAGRRSPPIAPTLQASAVMQRISRGGKAAGRDEPERRWFGRTPRVIPLDVYEADPGKVRMVWGLAAILLLTVLFSVIPVFRGQHFLVENAPGWARALLLLAAIQVVYVTWMITAPDWASVWVVVWIFAAVSVAYAIIAAMALATPLDGPMPFGMTAVRDTAARWCGAVLAVMCMATYLCGRAGSRWHRSFRRQMAWRSRRG